MAESVDIVLKARDEATGVITRARGKIEGQLKRFETRFTELSSKMSFMGQAGRIAFDSVSAAARIFKGDFEGAQELVEKLPLGIGEVATAMRGLAEELNGFREEMEKIKELNDDFARRQKGAARRAARGVGINAQLEGIIASLRGSDLDGLNAQYVQAQEKIAELFTKAFDPANPDANADTMSMIRRASKAVDEHFAKLFREADKQAIESLKAQARKADESTKKLLERIKKIKEDRELQSLIESDKRAQRQVFGGQNRFGDGRSLGDLGEDIKRMFNIGGKPKQEPTLGALFSGGAPQRQMQASPLAPVVEGSRLTGRTAAARSERQTEFIRRQTEQQKRIEKNTAGMKDLLQTLVNQGKNPAFNVVSI